MRRLMLLLIVCGAVAWHRSGGDEAKPPDPQPEETPAVSAGTEPVVHCVVDGVGGYVRRSECAERGGTVDEPLWARTP